jgi:hypothetical protein
LWRTAQTMRYMRCNMQEAVHHAGAADDHRHHAARSAPLTHNGDKHSYGPRPRARTGSARNRTTR